MSANRIHQSTPTQIMLDAADEVGFALQPETAIRGECPVRTPQHFTADLCV